MHRTSLTILALCVLSCVETDTTTITSSTQDVLSDIRWHTVYWPEGNEFEALALQDGSRIAVWPDESGNDRDALQADPLRQPWYVDEAVGGKPGVLFDGEDSRQYMSTSTFPTLAQPFSVFAVVAASPRMIDETQSRHVITGGSGVDLVHTDSSGILGFDVGKSLSSGVSIDYLTHAVVTIANGTSSVIRVDGTKQAGNAGSNTVNEWLVGWDNGLNEAFYDGYVLFMGVKAGEFTVDEINNLEGWAKEHYRLGHSRRPATSFWSSTSDPRAISYDGTLYLGAGSLDGASILEIEDGLIVGSHTFPVTDHASEHIQPSILIVPHSPPLTFYTNHHNDNFLRYRRGTQTIESGMAWGPERTINMGNLATYSRVHHYKGRIWVFTRSPLTSWKFVTSSDWGKTWSAPQAVFSGKWFYLKTAQADNLLRCAIGVHDKHTDGEFWYFEIDLETGVITDGTTTLGNLDGTNLPIEYEDGQLIAQATKDHSRLYGVSDGPEPEISWAEWDATDLSASGVYRYSVRRSGQWLTEEIVATGRRWATGAASYRVQPGEVFFPHRSEGGRLVLAREDSETWFLEEWTTPNDGKTWSVSELATSEHDNVRFARPHYTQPLDDTVDETVIFGRVYRFDDFNDWWVRLDSAHSPATD